MMMEIIAQFIVRHTSAAAAAATVVLSIMRLIINFMEFFVWIFFSISINFPLSRSSDDIRQQQTKKTKYLNGIFVNIVCFYFVFL